MSTMLTSKDTLPHWCYGCGQRVTYTRKGKSWVCDDCGHEYVPYSSGISVQAKINSKRSRAKK